MMIWHVQKLYTSEGCIYQALPYDFVETIKVTLKMNNGIRQMMKFLLNSRFTEADKGLFDMVVVKSIVILSLPLA